MIRLFAAVALAAALAVPAAVAAPPGAGVLVPGRSLGGIELGATKAQVERQGRAYGICRGARETWYFNYYAFQPRGAGVEWRNDTAAAVFTIYQPLGWRTRKGLELGDPARRVTALYGPLEVVGCRGYSAYVLRGRRTTTASTS